MSSVPALAGRPARAAGTGAGFRTGATERNRDTPREGKRQEGGGREGGGQSGIVCFSEARDYSHSERVPRQ